MKHAAFVIFYTDTFVFMNMRAKGQNWGFPGGMVEEDETLCQAAGRECLEEIGYSVQLDTDQYMGQLKVRDGLFSHAFKVKVSDEELMYIMTCALRNAATHAEEANGYAVFKYAKQDFYDMPLAPTVIEELEQAFGGRGGLLSSYCPI